MLVRIFAAAFVAVVIAATLMAIVTAFYPQSLLLVEPLVCEEWQTMEVSTRSIGGGEFTIDAVCTGDGEMLVLGRSLLIMFALYFTPFFLLSWLRGVISGRARKPGYFQTATPTNFTVSPGNRSHVQSFTVTTTSADPQMMQEMLGMVQEALKDGVISADEFEQIKAKAQSASQEDMGSLSKRLSGLQHAFDQGLITQEEFEQKRREIVESF